MPRVLNLMINGDVYYLKNNENQKKKGRKIKELIYEFAWSCDSIV